LIELSKARLYLAIGVPFETVWLPKIASANRDLKIVHTESNVKKIPMRVHNDHPQKNDEHDVSGLDPHIWLSPQRVKIQAAAITTALVEIDPSHAVEYQSGYDRFLRELDDLDAELRQLLKPCRGKGFMVFHPSWGYFAKDFDLKQIPIEVEGKEPKPAQLRQLIEQARRLKIKVIFTQPQFSTKKARVIAEAIGGRLVVADPLAEDWSDGLRRQAQQLNEAMR
jgi:zinc transport system substrate-binding protein